LSNRADGVLGLPSPVVPVVIGDVAPERVAPGLTGRFFFIEPAGGLAVVELDGEKHDVDRADLRHAVLVAAILTGATLTDANLQGADLRHAHLERADLNRADLRGARFDRAWLAGATFVGARGVDVATIESGIVCRTIVTPDVVLNRDC